MRADKSLSRYVPSLMERSPTAGREVSDLKGTSSRPISCRNNWRKRKKKKVESRVVASSTLFAVNTSRV